MSTIKPGFLQPTTLRWPSAGAPRPLYTETEAAPPELGSLLAAPQTPHTPEPNAPASIQRPGNSQRDAVRHLTMWLESLPPNVLPRALDAGDLPGYENVYRWVSAIFDVQISSHADLRRACADLEVRLLKASPSLSGERLQKLLPLFHRLSRSVWNRILDPQASHLYTVMDVLQELRPLGPFHRPLLEDALQFVTKLHSLSTEDVPASIFQESFIQEQLVTLQHVFGPGVTEPRKLQAAASNGWLMAERLREGPDKAALISLLQSVDKLGERWNEALAGEPWMRPVSQEALWGNKEIQPMHHVVRQGSRGDCWWLASLISYVASRPVFVRDKVEDLGNGHVCVSGLHDPTTGEATSPIVFNLEVEAKAYGLQLSRGYFTQRWVVALEIAVDKLIRERPYVFAGRTNQSSIGGWGVIADRILTGREGERVKFEPGAEGVAFARLRSALIFKKPVRVTQRTAGGGAHALAVTGYSPKDGFEVRNPHDATMAMLYSREAFFKTFCAAEIGWGL